MSICPWWYFFSREQYLGLVFLHGILLDLFDVLIIFRTGNEVFQLIIILLLSVAII